MEEPEFGALWVPRPNICWFCSVDLFARKTGLTDPSIDGVLAGEGMLLSSIDGDFPIFDVSPLYSPVLFVDSSLTTAREPSSRFTEFPSSCDTDEDNNEMKSGGQIAAEATSGDLDEPDHGNGVESMESNTPEFQKKAR